MYTCVAASDGFVLPALGLCKPWQDSEELLRNLHLAPYAKPIVSLIDDFPIVQRHKGWQFGYLTDNTTRRMTCAPQLVLLLNA